MWLKGARSLKFFCDNCLIGVRMVPQFIKEVDELRQELNSLKRAIPEKLPLVPEDTKLAEIQKREKREKYYDLHDVGKAKEIFQTLTKEDITVTKAIRMGTPNINRIRTVKVILVNSLDAGKVLRAKKVVLKGRKVYVIAYLSPMQYGNLKKLIEGVENRKQNGENVLLKYIKGVPTIIESSKN